MKRRSLSKRDLILLSASRVFRSSSSTCSSSPSFNSEDDTVIKAVIEMSWFGCRLNSVLFRRSPARCRRRHISSGPCRTCYGLIHQFLVVGLPAPSLDEDEGGQFAAVHNRRRRRLRLCRSDCAKYIKIVWNLIRFCRTAAT